MCPTADPRGVVAKIRQPSRGRIGDGSDPQIDADSGIPLSKPLHVERSGFGLST
jgi:hypothetical protein